MNLRSSSLDARARGAQVAAGLASGGLFLAVANAIGIVFTLPRGVAESWSVRLAHHAFDAAETVGVFAIAGLVVGAFVAVVRPPRALGLIFAALAAGALVQMAIGENLDRVSALLTNGHHDRALYRLFLVVLALLLPGAYLFSAWIAKRPRFRLFPLVLAVPALLEGYLRLPEDYQGIHCVVASGAALLAGGALATSVGPMLRSRWARGPFRTAMVALLTAMVIGTFVPPPNAVRLELFRLPAPVAPWVLVTTLWSAPACALTTDSPWMHGAPSDPGPLAPSRPKIVPPGSPPLVVLLSIDAVRADVVSDPANDALLPTLAKLRHDGVTFTHAYAPGTQTPISLASLFTGRTYSEMLWKDHGYGATRFLYPAEDPSVRFPEILSRHGVDTVDVASLSFLANDFGVARGFGEETMAVEGAGHAFAKQVIDPVLTRLHAQPASRGLFLFAHLMEPHAPYDRGRKDGTDRERYLSEIAVADAQIARVVSQLSQLKRREWLLIVTADHGEAFGEHGTHGHAKTLYDELLHVPLIVRSPRLPPRTVTDDVSLVDLGPTVLDLFEQPPPGGDLGRTLVPLLAPHASSAETASTEPAPPLFAEGRLRRSLRMPDGTKVIEDERRKTVEVYDLSVDPGETRNLFDRDPARANAALATLRTFFALRTRSEDGYSVPYKP